MSDSNLDSLIAPEYTAFTTIISTLKGEIEWPECMIKTGCSFDDISDLQLQFIEVKKSIRSVIASYPKDPERFYRIYYAITGYALFQSGMRQMSDILKECRSTSLPLARSIQLAGELRHMINRLSDRSTDNTPPSLMIE